MSRPVPSQSTDHPILSALEPVLRSPRHVRINLDMLDSVAGWMAWEGLGWPEFFSPLPSEAPPEDLMDFVFLTSTINFAFTDFETGQIFKVDNGGRRRWDSDAMVACLQRAHAEGVPVLDGDYLAEISRSDMKRIFRGNITIPMLDERTAIFREVGQRLASDHGGRFHNFVRSGPARAWAKGRGLLERLVDEFPSFRDRSTLDGQKVVFAKRSQLLLWMLSVHFRGTGFFELEDLNRLTAFADYILPVAFRILGIFEYSKSLEERIQRRELIDAHSREEIEIRAQTLEAVQLLTEAVNRRRPADRQIIAPVIDGRLWTHYHETSWPHHLTVTTAY